MKKYRIEKTVINGRTYFPRVEVKEKLSRYDPAEIQPSQLPVGRVSVDDYTNLRDLLAQGLEEFSTVTPRFSLDLLEGMQNLSIANPDVSQMVDNVVQLGNTGHRVVVEGVGQTEEDDILAHLNSFGKKVFHQFGGLEGCVNALFGQAARGGALSVEWVIKKDLSGIEKLVFVPLQTVRFVKDHKTGEYFPYQRVSNLTNFKDGYVELNPFTYQYIPLSILDNSPYAIPPILSALEAIMIQRDVVKNFRFVAKKMGLLGFVTFLINAPKVKPGESEEAFQGRCRAYLDEQAKSVKHNYRDGIAVGFKGALEVTHNTVMSSADGATKIFEQVEQQVFSGLKADPALHGRTYSTTETYAGVVYEKMLSTLTNYQRIVRAVLDYGYRLELALAGYNPKDLYTEFNPSKSLSAERDETTYETKLRNLSTLQDRGIIDQNQFAQEAGYDSPYLPEPPSQSAPADPAPTPPQQNRKSFVAVFNRGRGVYVKIEKPKVKLAKLSEKEPALEQQLDLEELFYHYASEIHEDCEHEQHLDGCARRESFETLPPENKKLNEFMVKYFRAVYPSIKGARQTALRELNTYLSEYDWANSDSSLFAEDVYKILAQEFGDALDSSPIKENIRLIVNKMYKHFRLTDASPFGGKFPVKPKFNLVDKRAIDFIRKSDDFYFGRYVTDPDTKKALKSWLSEEYLKSGASIQDPGQLDAFRKKFGDRVAQEDHKVVRIVETSASRAKNWGNALTIEQAKGYTIEIVGPLDNNVTCDWCRAMVGKVFKVKEVASQIKEISARDPKDLPQLSPFLPGRLHPAVVKETPEEMLAAQGITVPPYHPHCRHRHVVSEFED